MMKTRYAFLCGVLLAVLLLALRIVSPDDGEEGRASAGSSAAGEIPLRDQSPQQVEYSPPTVAAESPGDDSYLARHRSSLASADEEECQAAFRDLLQYLEESPQGFFEIAAGFKADPGLARNLPAFAATVPDIVLYDSELKNRLLEDVALHLAREHNDAGIRALALSVLGTLPANDSEVVELAGRHAREGGRAEVRSAVTALAAWAKETSPYREEASAELVRTIAGLEDHELWLHAVRSTVTAHAEVPDGLAPVLVEYLEADPSPDNYLRVAQAVAGHGNEATKVFAIELLGIAFLEEAHPGTRGMILNDLLELGAMESVAWARQVSLDDETLSRDARDYLEILQAGVTDRREIRDRKDQRDRDRGIFPTAEER